MSVLLWAILALAAGLAAFILVGWHALPKASPLPADLELPATPMQRTARWSLAVGLAFAAAAAGVLLAYGPDTTYDNDSVRLAFTILLVASIAVLGGASIRLKSWTKQESARLDERDRAILERAPAIQSIATLVTLAVWVVGLTERFHEAGAVPLFYLYLVFWSCLMMNALGLPAGILIGYRRR